LDIVLSENLIISLLGKYPKDGPTYNKDTCSTMFIAALFLIARSWKEPRCPSTEEWIQKMWYIYTMKYYSIILRQMNRTGKYHPERGNPDTKDHPWYTFTKWILAQKFRIHTI